MRPTLERAAGSENVDLKLSDFHGLSDINAKAVLSESYRNAVAASIFLAAAIRYNGTPRFVILDDVTSSFDAGHQFSLMEAIRTKLQQPMNVNGLQFIILSHDSALEKYFDKQNGTTDWSHQKLQGIRHTTFVCLQNVQHIAHQVQVPSSTRSPPKIISCGLIPLGIIKAGCSLAKALPAKPITAPSRLCKAIARRCDLHRYRRDQSETITALK